MLVSNIPASVTAGTKSPTVLPSPFLRQTATCPVPVTRRLCAVDRQLSSSSITLLSPLASQRPSTATSQGCIQEVSGRALTGVSTATGDMTLEKCTSYCAAAGFSMAGIEYSSECYCGHELSNGASLSLTSGRCDMPCSGDSSETCGGPAAISLYSTSSS